MSQYLLDTCILISMLKNVYGIREKITAVGPKNCFVAEASLAELFYGAYNSADPVGHLRDVSFISSHFRIIPTNVCLDTFGRVKASLRKKGLLIDDFDILIGSTAQACNLILVSDNVKHLQRIEGVSLENWMSRE